VQGSAPDVPSGGQCLPQGVRKLLADGAGCQRCRQLPSQALHAALRTLRCRILLVNSAITSAAVLTCFCSTHRPQPQAGAGRH
jgi:hypothetical protein